MLRGQLAEREYKPQFSGHGTFPLRYGWLKKAFDAVYEVDNKEGNKSTFANTDAIARFGVGKNMVESIRHWAEAVGVITAGELNNSLKTTPFGQALFSEDGWDRYLEHPSSLWLIHWKLCGNPRKTTWYWVFNHFTNAVFERENLVKALCNVSEEAGWRNVSPNTVKRDVDCFVRTYATRPIKNKEAHEDALECPLVELGLIKSTGTRDGFRLATGRKTSLKNGVFLYALLDFWEQFRTTSHLSFEALMHEPGSPGRVFLLNEDDVSDRLLHLEDLTKGQIRWSETAGLKQLIWDHDRAKIDPLSIIVNETRSLHNREAA
jgi:hypothetical protein